MDYDTTSIPLNYDRGRDHGPEFLGLWMDAVASYTQDLTVGRVLDLGCGTGRFSEGLAGRFGARVIAIDPSEKMLAQAREKCHDRRVTYATGRGESLAIGDSSVDLIFI